MASVIDKTRERFSEDVLCEIRTKEDWEGPTYEELYLYYLDDEVGEMGYSWIRHGSNRSIRDKYNHPRAWSQILEGKTFPDGTEAKEDHVDNPNLSWIRKALIHMWTAEEDGFGRKWSTNTGKSFDNFPDKPTI